MPSPQTPTEVSEVPRKPDWLRVRAPGGPEYTAIKEKLRELKLFTVCEEARCPNMGECWSGGTATIMLLGDVCTRGCKFCAVKTGNPRGKLDLDEPYKVADVISKSPFEYVVLTSVDRDDLPDQGADHFATTVREIKRLAPQMLVETLTPDWRGNLELAVRLVDAGVDVYAHNVETVPRLQRKVRDPRAGYEQSCSVLVAVKEHAAKRGQRMLTKTSIMLGLGETYEEVLETMKDLRARGVDVITFGQYLQPTKRHLKVERFVTPAEFQHLEQVGKDMGYAYIASGALVRSSYKAGEFFITNMLKGNTAHGIQAP
jgi:lipoic acid synthetase